MGHNFALCPFFAPTLLLGYYDIYIPSKPPFEKGRLSRYAPNGRCYRSSSRCRRAGDEIVVNYRRIMGGVSNKFF